jgi:quercetin dioxygenase-like cupin family protein
MDIDIKRAVIELEPHAVLPLHDASGAKIACLEGVLWITQQDDRNDFVLEAGESLILEKEGEALVQALQGSRIAVEAPARH